MKDFDQTSLQILLIRAHLTQIPAPDLFAKGTSP